MCLLLVSQFSQTVLIMLLKFLKNNWSNHCFKKINITMIRILLITAFASIFLNSINAQSLTKEQVENLVNGKHYTFLAERLTTQRGSTKILTSDYYTLKVAGDSLICDLPYYGRAYTAPINPEDAGYNFTSTDFDYKVADKKKNSYQVTITTKDKVNAAMFVLTVYSNGNAYLQITSTQRQPISFYGLLKGEKQ